jgi:hypothetical protein
MLFEKLSGMGNYHEANRQATTYKPACAPKIVDGLSSGIHAARLEKDLFKVKLPTLLVLLIIGGIVTLYAPIYYHELINQHIFAEYGISSKITLHIPYTYKSSLYWQGEPNATDYTLGTTMENQTQMGWLYDANKTKYNELITTITINENANMGISVFGSLIVFIFYGFILLESV